MKVAEGASKFAQQPPHPPTSVKKLAQQAIKRPFLAILPALGEYFHAITIDRSCWANFVAPTLLTAPRGETVSTNAGASGRLHETHDAFAHQNSAENGCIGLAMVPSVSPKIEHAPAKAMTVSRESPAAPVSDSSLLWRVPEGTASVPVGGGGARLRCPWATRPGRGRRTEPHISDQAPPV